MHFLIYNAFDDDDVFAAVTNIIDGDHREELCETYFGAFSKMAQFAESVGASGSIWKIWLAHLIAQEENTFALAHERRNNLSGTLNAYFEHDAELLEKYANFDFEELAPVLGGDFVKTITHFEPSCKRKSVFCDFAAALHNHNYANAIRTFYAEHGVGKFALNKGFRWNGEAIVPAFPLDDMRLSDIIGYEVQKNIICRNTEAFIAGRPANNVLLYGESGTGKSSTIKALLNEYDIRMIEVYKHQIADLEKILDEIKSRNHKFIILMDDLSFERFETDYKFLKAFIEGGIEKKPDNVLIYATSNRRHLMREAWSDRADKNDDMHESETQQERMSLSDRFGLMIRYIQPEQAQYLEIAYALADERKIIIEDNEKFEHDAIQWELKHGGFSGRSARQYIDFLAGCKGDK